MSEENHMIQDRIQIGNRLYKAQDVYQILDVRDADWIEADEGEVVADPDPEPIEE